MNCSICGTIMIPSVETNHGTDTRPVCKKCAALPDKGPREAPLYQLPPLPPDKPDEKKDIKVNMCSLHPGVPAVQTCQICQAPICQTCDFVFPDNVHVCPNCVNKPQPMPGNRKRNLIISYVMAGLSTLGYIFSFYLGAIEAMTEDVIGISLLIFGLGPAIIGISVGTSTRVRGRKKPISTWVTMIWNGILIGFYLTLLVIGNLMG